MPFNVFLKKGRDGQLLHFEHVGLMRQLVLAELLARKSPYDRISILELDRAGRAYIYADVYQREGTWLATKGTSSKLHISPGIVAEYDYAGPPVMVQVEPDQREPDFGDQARLIASEILRKAYE